MISLRCPPERDCKSLLSLRTAKRFACKRTSTNSKSYPINYCTSLIIYPQHHSASCLLSILPTVQLVTLKWSVWPPTYRYKHLDLGVAGEQPFEGPNHHLTLVREEVHLWIMVASCVVEP